MKKLFEVNVLHPNRPAWRHTYIYVYELGNLTIVKEMEAACYRLQNIRYTTLSRGVVAILASTHQRPQGNFHGYWSHLNLLQSPSREAWEDKKVSRRNLFPTWKVSLSPRRLAAKSGVLTAVAANILCTLLPSGSLPSFTIWDQRKRFNWEWNGIVVGYSE